jgi:hypothetical protein
MISMMIPEAGDGWKTWVTSANRYWVILAKRRRASPLFHARAVSTLLHESDDD